MEAVTISFKNTYDKESDAIFRFCLIRVSDREQALDITQETFLRFWQNLVEGKEINNKKAFLFTIAHRLIIDWYRKKKSVSLDKILDRENEGEVKNDIVDETTVDNINMKAEGRYLLEKIKELPENYQQIIYLRFVEGLSPPEISKIIDISVNATSVKINRGLAELRKITGYTQNN